MTAFRHRRHYKVCAAHGIAAGKDLLLTGLITVTALHSGFNTPLAVQRHPRRLQPGHAVRVEAKGHDHRICRHNKLAAGDRRRTASSPGVRSAQLGAQKAYPVNPPVLVQLKRHRLDVKLKERPLFAGVFDLFFRARHVGFISPIGAGHLAERGAHAVHRRIAAAQHHHVQPGGVDIRLLRRCRQPHHLFGVGDEERQRIVDPGGLFVR